MLLQIEIFWKNLKQGISEVLEGEVNVLVQFFLLNQIHVTFILNGNINGQKNKMPITCQC